MIEVIKITYQYPGGESTFTLRGVSFQLNRGERVALMGANGSGKTTFIRCLNGLLIPREGEVCVDGHSTRDASQIYEVRRLVGMAFQNPDNQIVATTVDRELAFGMENIGIPTDEMKKRVSEALERFHMESYRTTAPHLLSGGERQKLALASIWVMRPKYLVLDEPTSLLDPQGRREVLELIRRESDEGKIGVLLVTQFPEEALGFDRLVIMDKGEIVLDGPPHLLFQHEELESMGLAVPTEIALETYWEKLNRS